MGRRCPRCGYDLRAAPVPRCAECGLEFPEGEFAAGVLRERIPSRLDRCDPWQPLHVAGITLLELLDAMRAPRRKLRRVDVDGPLLPAVLMITTGPVWTATLIALAAAVGVFWHAEASPAAALRTGFLFWMPRLMALTAPVAFASVAATAVPGAARLAHGTLRHRLRLAAWWMPAIWAWCVLPVAAPLVALPEMIPETAAAAALGGAGYVALVSTFAARGVTGSSRRSGMVALVVTLAGVASTLGAWRWLPRWLTPPLWIYG